LAPKENNRGGGNGDDDHGDVNGISTLGSDSEDTSLRMLT